MKEGSTLYEKLLAIEVSENPVWKELLKIRIHYRDLNLKYWLDHNAFSSVWWIMLISFIAIWVIWWKIVNKSRLFEIITYGVMISFTATIVDELGVALVLWSYPITLVPLFLPLVFVNLGALPIIFMLVYQYFDTWKLFTGAILITSFILAFALEPLTSLLGIYEINNWKYIYSVPIYFVTPLFFKWLINRIKVWQEHSK